jgi:hypothetical protein
MMTVLNAPYIHRVNLRYCKCSRSDHATQLQQLLRNSWWPATVTSPATCATFETLELYRLLNVTGNMNAHDFIKSLERATNATGSTGMDWTPVSALLTVDERSLTLADSTGTLNSSG